MARPKEFDRETALSNAMEVFGDHGYEGSSTEVLMREMGISRQSMYDTFGDKRRLYLEALQHYVADQVAGQIRTLNTSSSALKGLEAALLAFALKAADGPGCMGIGAICEFGRSDQEVTILIDTAEKTLRSALEHRIADAKAAGEICAEVDMRAAADFLTATFAAIKIAGRGGASLETLRNIARMAIRSLK
jgi:TetR/AcrR family transcriptional repressor of nem operon